MSLFVELIPIVVFFIVYQWADLYMATTAIMIVSILQIITSWLQQQHISTERWMGVMTLMLFGSTTLIFKNAHFIKLKPTILYGIFAALLAFTRYRHRITLLEKRFGDIMHLSRQSWAQLNTAWVIFFCIMGLLNLIVAYTTETGTWVYFKCFGFPSLMVLFMIGQLIYLSYFNKNRLNHEFIQR